MNVAKVKISDLIPYANNARTHSDDQINQIASSIKEFGFTNPVLIDKDNGIIAGHGRVSGALKLGMKSVPTICLDGLTKPQIKAYILADNRLAENAGWDMDLVSIELQELQDLEFDIDLTGFSLDDIQIDDDGLTDEDEVPDVPEIPVTNRGDVWLLGSHRLMCGDSTRINDVEQLMDGRKVDIAFTSPPYNVGKTPNGNNKKYLNDADNKTEDEYRIFLNDFTNNALLFSDYVFSNIQSLAGNKIALISHVYDMRKKYADTIIWDKGSAEPAMARKVLNSRFEYVYIFSNEASRSIGKRDFRGTISNIIEIKSRQDKEFSKIHKATYPVEFACFFIENFTESTVLDQFGGTGTTLIASEKLRKKCYTMELDARYCDVIINRWQDYTGKKAILESTNEEYKAA